VSIKDYTQKQQDELEELLAGAALDALSDQDFARLEDYFKLDPGLELDFIEHLECSVALSEALPQIAPPASLRQEILNISSTLAPIPIPSQPKTLFTWRNFAIAVGIALVSILSLNNVGLRQQLTIAQTKIDSLSEKETHIFALQGTPSAHLSAGMVLLDGAANRASLALNHLKPLKPSETYHLWAIVGSKLISCGQFRVGSQNRVVEAISIPENVYSETLPFTLIVTIESSRNPAKPSSAIVMTTKTEI
jgi:Anti-sigma-K factor rskA